VFCAYSNILFFGFVGVLDGLVGLVGLAGWDRAGLPGWGNWRFMRAVICSLFFLKSIVVGLLGEKVVCFIHMTGGVPITTPRWCCCIYRNFFTFFAQDKSRRRQGRMDGAFHTLLFCWQASQAD